MALQAKDFGDRARGRVVSEDLHLVRPARVVSGTVVGVWPYDPKHVSVQTPTGERVTIRVAS